MSNAEWKRTTLGDISSIRRGASPRPISDPRWFSTNGPGWVRIVDVTRSQKYLRRTEQQLSELGAQRSVRVKPGDVIMSICASIGVPVIVDMQACIHDGFVLFDQLSSDVTSEYLYYFLSLHGPLLARQGQAGTQKNINTDIVKRTPFPLPPLEEQSSILELVRLWDSHLTTVANLLELKRRLKQGMVQRFLNGNLRFRKYSQDVLEHVPLHDVLEKIATGVNTTDTEMYREIGVRSHGKGLFYKEPISGASLGNKRVYRVIPGCVTLNIVFAWERAIAVTTDRERDMIVSHRFPMFRPDPTRLLPEYALEYLLSKKGAEALDLASPGGAGRNRTLSQTQLLKTRIPLPSVAEQRRVIAFIHATDREIELLQKQLGFLRQQKQGLMKRLLSGQLRPKSTVARRTNKEASL